MDNLIFKKIWEDEGLIELEISAASEFASAYQNCYIQQDELGKISEKICNFIYHFDTACYLEFGKKEGNYTPAFSMCIMPADMSGHVNIEVDIEIADNDTRSHRCCFFVRSELGTLEQLGLKLKKMEIDPKSSEASLYY